MLPISLLFTSGAYKFRNAVSDPIKILTLFVFFIVVILVHGQALGFYFVQDDAYPYFASSNWLNIYQGIGTDLQYRPNAFLISKVLLELFGVNVWVLRFFGILVIYLIGTMMYLWVATKTGNNALGFLVGLINIVHPGYYSFAVLFLSSAMTGLGVILSIACLWLFYNGISKDLRISYFASLIMFVLALLSYEAAIAIAPLAFLIVIFSKHSELSRTLRIRKWAPIFLISIVYLAFRYRAISRYSENDQLGQYNISPSSVLDNFLYLESSLFGKYIWLTFSPIRNEIALQLIFWIFILVSGFAFARAKKILGLFSFAFVSILFGFLPFLLVGVNGKTLHYVVYGIPGFSIVLSMALLNLRNLRLKGANQLFLATSLVVVLFFSFLNLAAYKGKVLVAQALSSRAISLQFEQTTSEYPEPSKFVFLNTSFHTAATIQFGLTLNALDMKKAMVFQFPTTTPTGRYGLGQNGFQYNEADEKSDNSLFFYTEIFKSDFGSARPLITNVTPLVNVVGSKRTLRGSAITNLNTRGFYSQKDGSYFVSDSRKVATISLSPLMRQIDQTKPITAVIFVKGLKGEELISLKSITSKRNRQNTCESIKIVPTLGEVVVSTSFPPELSQTFRPPLHQGIETCDFSKFGY
jgi:hypothetical protein